MSNKEYFYGQGIKHQYGATGSYILRLCENSNSKFAKSPLVIDG
ncbi:MAG: hypothetical protein ACI9LY_000295 [Arenicella sp.]|jgi:hypothetical protein